MVTMPPRHGKSELCSHYFPAWFLGNYPDREVILCSYEADFAASWGRKVRDTLTECQERGVFPVGPRGDVKAANRWQIASHRGGMVTAGAGGAITGRGADLLIIDDPFKNAQDANSETIRESVWAWWQSTASTRLSPGGVVLLVNTRWHLDDLSGRLLEYEPERWQVVNFPAVAEEADVLGRQPGDALWPQHYPLATLREMELVSGSYWWAALYQQRPVTRGGEMFRREWFRIGKPAGHVLARVRYWDRAATAQKGSEDPDWTVGALVSRPADGAYCIEHVERFRGGPLECEQRIRQTAESDGRAVPVWMEQEPGSSGVDTIDNYRRRVLVGYSFRGDRVSGDKESRADLWAAPAEAGLVSVAPGAWNSDFLAEVEQFPRGKKKDQVDAVSGAVKCLGANQVRPQGTAAPVTIQRRSII
jgi:predicted phage terminase large subunit-like protein